MLYHSYTKNIPTYGEKREDKKYIMKPNIYLICGPAGAGKSTIANMLVGEFEKSVLIEVDEIRHMIKRGMPKCKKICVKVNYIAE